MQIGDGVGWVAPGGNGWLPLTPPNPPLPHTHHPMQPTRLLFSAAVHRNKCKLKTARYFERIKQSPVESAVFSYSGPRPCRARRPSSASSASSTGCEFSLYTPLLYQAPLRSMRHYCPAVAQRQCVPPLVYMTLLPWPLARRRAASPFYESKNLKYARPGVGV